MWNHRNRITSSMEHMLDIPRWHPMKRARNTRTRHDVVINIPNLQYLGFMLMPTARVKKADMARAPCVRRESESTIPDGYDATDVGWYMPPWTENIKAPVMSTPTKACESTLALRMDHSLKKHPMRIPKRHPNSPVKMLEGACSVPWICLASSAPDVSAWQHDDVRISMASVLKGA